MSNEIAHIHRGPTGEVFRADDVAAALPAGVNALRAWAMSLSDATALAQALVRTPFVPDSYKPRVPDRASAEQHQEAYEVAVATAAAAMMHGAGLGFDPMSSLLNLYVVAGRPGLYADAAAALLLAAGHEIWEEECTASRAVVCGRRRGSTVIERAEVTMDMARRAGWTRNQKYQSEPDVMLRARALSRVCKRVAPDVLRGLPCVEDMQDGDEAPAAMAVRTIQRSPLPAPDLPEAAAEAPAPAAEEKPKTTRARKKAAAPPAGASSSSRPQGEEGPPPLPGDESQAETGELVSPQQLTQISGGFAALGLVGRDECRAYVEGILGRQLTDPTKMTRSEAAAVLAAMAEAKDRPQAQEDGAEPEPEPDDQGVLDVEPTDDGPDES